MRPAAVGIDDPCGDARGERARPPVVSQTEWDAALTALLEREQNDEDLPEGWPRAPGSFWFRRHDEFDDDPPPSARLRVEPG